MERSTPESPDRPPETNADLVGALRDAEERYRSALAVAANALLVVDADGRVLEANPAASELLRCPRPALIGRCWHDFALPTAKEPLALLEAAILTTGTGRTNLNAQRADGEPIDVEVRGQRLPGAGGPLLLLGFRDVTERARAQRSQELLARKVLVAQEEERARLSRELHDELGQLLSALRLNLGWLQKRFESAPEEQRSQLGDAVQLCEKSAEELRRICRGLRPPMLDDLGLEPAARQLCLEFGERTGIQIDLQLPADESRPLDHTVALCTYRVLQEALNNVSRHAQARQVTVTLRRSERELLLAVIDDGVGFDPSAEAAQQGCGLAGMRERALLAGGDIAVHSTRQRGTRVVLRIALPGGGRELS